MLEGAHTIPSAPPTTPVWRREPYRVFFPLGLLLAWAGVLHWLGYGLGLGHEYRAAFHSIVQIQGFMICFAVGFLFTAIPRRTGTPAPAAWQMVVGIGAPIGCSIAAWFELWALSQVCWLLLVATLISFIVRRFLARDARRMPPNAFLWVPLSLGMGIAGSLLLAAYGILGARHLALHYLGKLLARQGLFLGLVAGVGALALPLITRGEVPPDAGASRRDDLVRIGHVALALLLVVSFVLETFAAQRAGLALRAAVVAAALLLSGRLWLRPTLPGLHRRLVWLSAWLIPAGYVLAAATPGRMKAGLHVVFIGGFALMALAVGMHVTLAHGGYRQLVNGRPWQAAAFGSLLLVSALLRALADYDPTRRLTWIAAAAAAFLLATLCWAALILPRIWRPASAG